jgi:hypothetical protein
MRLVDYAWRLSLPPTDGSYMVERGHDWARAHGYKKAKPGLSSEGGITDELALEIGVYLEDGWSAKHLNAFVKGRLPKVESKSKAEPEPEPTDVAETEPLEPLKSGEERLTERYLIRVGERELRAWHAYAERENKPLAWLIRRNMRDHAEWSQFKSDNSKGVADD